MWRICPSRTGSNISSYADGRWHGRTLGREMLRGSQVTLERTIHLIRRSRNWLLITPIRPSATTPRSLKPSVRDEVGRAPAPPLDHRSRGRGSLPAINRAERAGGFLWGLLVVFV